MLDYSNEIHFSGFDELTIRPAARKGYESIAHEAEGNKAIITLANAS